MKEKTNKKSIYLMFVGALTLLVLVSTATFAYFQISVNGSSNPTLLNTSIEDGIGSFTISEGGEELTLNLTIDDMANTTAAKKEYKATTIRNNEIVEDANVGKLTKSDANVGRTYTCYFEIIPRATGIDSVLEKDNSKFIISSDSANVTFSETEDGTYSSTLQNSWRVLRSNATPTYYGKWVTGLSSEEVAYVKLAASIENIGDTQGSPGSGNQNHLAGLTGTLSFKLQNMTCSSSLTNITATRGGNPVKVTVSDVQESEVTNLRNGLQTAGLTLSEANSAKLVEVSVPSGTGNVTIELDVSGFASNGETVALYHYNGSSYDAPVMAKVINGKVTATFSSLSPIAIVNRGVVPAYTIHFNTNGGSSISDMEVELNKVININNPTKSSQTITINQNNQGATLSSNTVTRSYTFNGWTATNLNTSTAKYGSNNNPTTSWTNGNTIVTSNYFKGLGSENTTVTLTANWLNNAVTLPTVTKTDYTCGYTTSSTGTTIEYESGSTYRGNSNTLYVYCKKPLLSFTLNGNTYYFEEGMTWLDFSRGNSEINLNCGLSNALGSWVIQDEGGSKIILDGSEQYCSDLILSGDYSWRMVCFIAGTQVQYSLDGKTKNIEDFKIGDDIVSYNVDTGEYYMAKVRGYKHTLNAKNIYDVTLDDDTVLSLTENHPILTNSGFKAINNDKYNELKLSDLVKTTDGYKRILSIRKHTKIEDVYNLGVIDKTEVEDNDLYDTFVANGVVVHNY